MRYSQAITRKGLGITPSLLKLWQRLRQIPGTVLVTGLTLMVACSGMSLEGWQFESLDLLAGRPWTTLTSHLLHFDTGHLFWDLTVFVGVGAALERKQAGLFWTTLLVAAWVVPVLAVLGQSSVNTYRGLSGIDTALFAAFATWQWKARRRAGRRQEARMFTMLLMAMLAKSLFELVTGSSLFVSSDEFTPLPTAHLVGAAVGVGLAAVWPPAEKAASRSVPVFAVGRPYRARRIPENCQRASGGKKFR